MSPDVYLGSLIVNMPLQGYHGVRGAYNFLLDHILKPLRGQEATQI